MKHASPLLTVMMRAALKAARKLNRDFGELDRLQVSRKGIADFVSTADHNAEKTLVEELLKARPKFGVLTEETLSCDGQSSSRWIIDPLDGTTNFLHAIPHFAISIAAEDNGEIIAGVVYDPIRDEMFAAEKGRGAFLNNSRLRVSERRDLSQAIIAVAPPRASTDHHDRQDKCLNHVTPHIAATRRFGSVALDLAYVSAGRFEGFWEMGPHYWDVAAGMLLVTEAGGCVSTLTADKKPITPETDTIIAGNSHLYQPLLDKLMEV